MLCKRFHPARSDRVHNKCLFVHNFLHRMSLITCYHKKVWLYNNTLSQNQPKWSLWGFSVLRHPNHLILVGVNRRNVINTQQFYAAPDQANWEFFWHTDCMLQLQVHTFLQNTRELPGCLLEISPSGRKSLWAWRTLQVYTSVTPCLMHDSRSRKGTVFVPKHGKKTCKGTD